MPRTPRFRNEAVADLLRQVRYAPKAARLRQMRHAETLLGELDPAQAYPRDYVVFRVTGYRPDPRGPEPTLTGESLLADLSAFITTLSRGLDLPADHDGRRAIDMATLARRLGVSEKTVQRYRQRGLACHVIRFAPGSSRLGCYEDALERFLHRHADLVATASNFTRLSDEQVEAIIADARAWRDAEGLSLNEAAARLAERYHRAHETIRGILRRHDRAGDAPIFTDPGPLTGRQIALIERAARIGVDTARLAERFGRTTSSIHRAIRRARLRRLADVDLQWVELPTFSHDDAEDVLLRPSAVRTGLVHRPPCADALELIDRLRTVAPDTSDLDNPDNETARAVAFHLLKRRASFTRASLGEWPNAGPLDALETDLRWAVLLKRRLILDALPAALRKIELTLGRSITTQPADLIRRLLEEAVAVAGRCAEQHDPTRQRRLGRLVEYAMDRRLARMNIAAPKRAAALHRPDGIATDGLLDAIMPGCEHLTPAPVLRLLTPGHDHPPRLTGDDRDLLTARYGLDGDPPRTLAALAREHRTTSGRMAVRLRRIERDLHHAPAKPPNPRK